MSCLNVTIERIGKADLSAALIRSAMCVRITRAVTRMSVILEPVCKSSLAGPYLEIEPHILWITDWGSNDVYSNTDWIVQ